MRKHVSSLEVIICFLCMQAGPRKSHPNHVLFYTAFTPILSICITLCTQVNCTQHVLACGLCCGYEDWLQHNASNHKWQGSLLMRRNEVYHCIIIVLNLLISSMYDVCIITDRLTQLSSKGAFVMITCSHSSLLYAKWIVGKIIPRSVFFM